MIYCKHLTYKVGRETTLVKWNEREDKVELILQDSDGVTQSRFCWTVKALVALAILHRTKTLESLPTKDFLRGGQRDLNGCPAPDSYVSFGHGFTWSWSKPKLAFEVSDQKKSVRLVPEVVQAFIDRYTS